MALPFTVTMFVPVVSVEHVPLTVGSIVGVLPPDTIPLLEPPLELPPLEWLPELPEVPLELELPPEPELEAPLDAEPPLLPELPFEPELPEDVDPLEPPEPPLPEPDPLALAPDDPLLDGSPKVVPPVVLLPQAARRRKVAPSASWRRIDRSGVCAPPHEWATPTS
jgi:hypothetical protein